MSILLYGCTTWTNKMLGEKARQELNKDATCCIQQILKAAPYKTKAVWPLISHLPNHTSKASKTCWALLKKQE